MLFPPRWPSKQGKSKAKHTTNLHEVVYHASSGRQSARQTLLLVGCGANGGIVRVNVCMIATTFWHVNVTRIDNYQLVDLWIVTAGGVCSSYKGEKLVVMHQYAYNPDHQIIHSSMQMEHFGIQVDDCSVFCGSQKLHINYDYVLPLTSQNGIPYLAFRPLTDAECYNLMHVILTSDADGDPDVTDQEAPFTVITAIAAEGTHEPQVSI